MSKPVLIAGSWRDAMNPSGSFTGENPTTKEKLLDHYPVSGLDDVLAALNAGQQAATILRTLEPAKIADFLDCFAGKIEDRAPDLVQIAHIETGLPEEPRLRTIELPRTINQLRQAAQAARSRSWCQAVIDTQSNIRSKFGPLGGPVVVFGPNNFPYAFNGAAGGDFAAAIAAGNPVIAKANPGHPGTTEIFGELALEALEETGMPLSTVQLIYRTTPEVGLALVSHPLVGATGFTGSRWAGIKLKEAADKAGKPIYLEMSSVNPVFVLPGALKERGAEIAAELFGSCAMGAGQFCTSPGLTVLLADERGKELVEEVSTLFKNGANGVLLGSKGPKGIALGVEVLQQNGAEIVVGGNEDNSSGYSFSNTVLKASGQAFLDNPEALQTEAFGTVNLMVLAQNVDQMVQIAAQLEGNLTGCLYSDSQGADDPIYDQIEPVLRQRVGRLLNDKMPTGVAVVPSMNHGGPYPATGHPGFTAVGIPSSMVRFAALHSYDNVRPHRLPPELSDNNPTGEMWRNVDGQWTQKDI